MSAARIDLPGNDDAGPYEIAWIKATLRGAKPDGPPPEYFSQRYRAIARAIHEDLRQGRTPDLLTLHERCDGATFDQIRDLMNGLGAPENIDQWAQRVYEAGLLRNALQRLENGAEQLRAGRNVDAVLADLRELIDAPGPKPQGEGFRLVRAADLQVRPAHWVVRDWLELDSLALGFGDPGSAKSFFGIDVACCIATGTDWHGAPVSQAPVAYIAGEGHNGITRRFRAWSIRHGVDLQDAPLFVSTGAAALCNPQSTLEVLASLAEVAEKYGDPGLVVLDTVARNFGPGDENSTQDMTAFIAAADTIRSRYGCAVLMVHHTGHSDKSRARGAMALKGALDFEYRLEKDDQGVVRLEATKVKDHEHPEPKAFRLRTVELPFEDDDGQPVTSAVLDETAFEPAPSKGKAGRGKWQTLALEVLEDLHQKHRAAREASGHDPAGARVSIDDWRSACLDAGMPRQRFYNTKDTLAEHGLVTIERGFVQ